MICCVRIEPRQSAWGRAVMKMRRAQLSFGDGLIAEEVSDLREGWMTHADQVLADEQIVAAVYEALAKRHPKSRSRGRLGAPAEMVLRLLILKHIRNWSYGVLEREVRANLVYRDFTRVGAGKTPDAKTMGRWGLAVGPEVVKQIHQRLVKLAQANGLAAGRRMRVDTTVVETNVHYPTDSSLLGDGVGDLADSPKAGEAGSSQRVGSGAQNARGHHRGGDQRPLSDRFELVGRWRAGSDPHHEKDWQDRRRDWRQAARPQSQREAAGPGHRPGGALQSQAEPGEAQSILWQAAQCDQPSGGTGETVLQRGRQRNQARKERPAAVGTRRPAPGARRDGAAGQASDEADESAYLPRRHTHRR